mgnify:CR=1 FL=1
MIQGICKIFSFYLAKIYTKLKTIYLNLFIFNIFIMLNKSYFRQLIYKFINYGQGNYTIKWWNGFRCSFS